MVQMKTLEFALVVILRFALTQFFFLFALLIRFPFCEFICSHSFTLLLIIINTHCYLQNNFLVLFKIVKSFKKKNACARLCTSNSFETHIFDCRETKQKKSRKLTKKNLNETRWEHF